MPFIFLSLHQLKEACSFLISQRGKQTALLCFPVLVTEHLRGGDGRELMAVCFLVFTPGNNARLVLLIFIKNNIISLSSHLLSGCVLTSVSDS
jgi:hypothetical protein